MNEEPRLRFDNASSVEEVIWDMRLSEQTRAEDRTVILKTANGNPPFDEATVEENNISVNISDLSLPNLLAQARQQWNNAHLKPSNFFTARPDSGPGHKRSEWSQIATSSANRLLKRNRRMVGQVRATGAQTVLTGIGPTNWKDRRSIIPVPIPVGSLMIPSETEIDDFDNLSYFAVFREWTPAMLWDMTHGPKVDPGWNMELVQSQWEFIKDELRKSPNSLAYQYMPERIEELIKQDKGYCDTDALPTCDVWDFYFRQAEDGEGWYRRIILDWNTGQDISSYKKSGDRTESRNKIGDKYGFLYSSGHRKYANSVSEIIHCNFGDCSAYAPFKYHSVRSLAWMLWGICELQGRFHCKFQEALFEQLMWFFQTAGNQDLVRLKKANFEHMGVIPQGIKFLTAKERFTPDMPLIELGFNRNRQLMNDSSFAYKPAYDKGPDGQERTATETMAIVNSSQSLSSAILEMSYTYEAFKYREMVRRLWLKNSTDPMARECRLACLKGGIPENMLDVEKWSIEPEQVLGGGNKTVQMATVGFLNQIRKNLPPYGQRLVDHISVEAATDQPDLAEEIAPVGKDKPISDSTHDAQEATMRLLHGLPFQPPREAIHEDYVVVWLHDLGMEIQRVMKRGGMATPDEMQGMINLGKHLAQFLGIMEKQSKDDKGDKDSKAKVRKYQDMFAKLMNHVKGLAQRMEQAAGAKKGKPGAGADGNGSDAAKVQATVLMGQVKAKQAKDKGDQALAHKEKAFQSGEKRKNAQTAAEIQRGGVRTRHELLANRLKALNE